MKTLYTLFAILIGIVAVLAGIFFIRGALGYWIESIWDFILYFIHNLASVFIFFVGSVTALISISEALERKKIPRTETIRKNIK